MLIFTTVFGITVDDTIHFIGKIKIELDRGQDSESAVVRAFKTTARSMFITSIVLLVGFLPLVFPVSTAHTGWERL